MTPEQEQYIISNWEQMTSEELRKRFNNRYGTLYKTTAFCYHTKRLGLSKHIRHMYTARQDDFLRNHAGEMTRKQLAELFNETFGTEIKEQAIEQRCFLNGWKPQSDGKFKKGDVPWCKSKGGRDAYVKKLKGGNSGSFRKGHKLNKEHPVGAVAEWGHNVVIKTQEGWKNRLRYLWEKEYGNIPNGYVVISVDGDKHTEDATKLRLIPNKVLTILISNNWNNKGTELVDTGIAWSNLKILLGNEM